MTGTENTAIPVRVSQGASSHLGQPGHQGEPLKLVTFHMPARSVGPMDRLARAVEMNRSAVIRLAIGSMLDTSVARGIIAEVESNHA